MCLAQVICGVNHLCYNHKRYISYRQTHETDRQTDKHDLSHVTEDLFIMNNEGEVNSLHSLDNTNIVIYCQDCRIIILAAIEKISRFQ